MPKVTMPKDHPSAALIVNGQRVERGQSVEVDADLAAQLAEQGWVFAKGDDLPSKDDLLAIAAERGVEVKPSWSKQKIAEALADAPTITDASDDADPQES